MIRKAKKNAAPREPKTKPQVCRGCGDLIIVRGNKKVLYCATCMDCMALSTCIETGWI